MPVAFETAAEVLWIACFVSKKRVDFELEAHIDWDLWMSACKPTRSSQNTESKAANWWFKDSESTITVAFEPSIWNRRLWIAYSASQMPIAFETAAQINSDLIWPLLILSNHRLEHCEWRFEYPNCGFCLANTVLLNLRLRSTKIS